MARLFTATPRCGPLARVPPASDTAIGARIKLDASSTGVGPLKHGALAATSAPHLSHQLRFENGHGPAQRAYQAKHRVDTTLEATRSSNSKSAPPRRNFPSS
jgi:hypothetical protein